MLKLGNDKISGLYLGDAKIVKAYLGGELVFSKASKLPAGYVELEYIESTGTQYINTGFNPNGSTRVIADFQFTDASKTAAIFGARITKNNSSYQFLIVSGEYRSDYNNGYTQLFDNVDASKRNIVDKNAETTTVGGESKSYAKSSFQCPVPMYIFASNGNGSTAFLSLARLYSLSIHDNGTAIRDFVPCQNPAGVVGLYDMIEGEFYGNAGTGAFVSGPAV